MDSACGLCNSIWICWTNCLYDLVPSAFRVINPISRGNMANQQTTYGNFTLAQLKNTEKNVKKLLNIFVLSFFIFLPGAVLPPKRAEHPLFFL